MRKLPAFYCSSIKILSVDLFVCYQLFYFAVVIIWRLRCPFPEFLNFFVLRQILSLIIEALCWCSMLVMIFVETKVYIREFRWFVRFGVIYTLVGDAVMVNLVLSVKNFYNRFWLCWFSSRFSLFLLLSFWMVIYFAAVEIF